MINFLPLPVVILLLGAVGVCLGAIINLAIYQLAVIRRPVSPWTKAGTKNSNRTWHDRIPIYGWLRLRRESELFGHGFWVRPMMIEIVSGIWLIALFVWYSSGGLFGVPDSISEPPEETLQHWIGLWFVVHAVLFVLLAIATFIDFDEQTIPDWITIPGSVFALIVAVLFPQTRLPTISTNLVANQIESLHFRSPLKLTAEHHSWEGLAIAMLIVLIWCFALLPRMFTLRKGFAKGIQFFLAAFWPRPRKTQCSVRIRERGIGGYHWMIVALLLTTSTLVGVVWSNGGIRWDSLFGALVGLGFGGGLVWSVRIIASSALNAEAMGFGDVTLMAMIGAFLGWQPALLIFGLAPFTSLAIIVVQRMFVAEQRIAFGPYLCIAAAIVVLGWYPIWNYWAADRIFVEGFKLLGLIAIAVFLGGVVLFVWGIVKGRMIQDLE